MIINFSCNVGPFIFKGFQCLSSKLYRIFELIEEYTRNNRRLGSAFDDLDPKLSLRCQVGDDVVRLCKICRGCQIRFPRSIHSLIVPYNLDSKCNKECVLSTSNAIIICFGLVFCSFCLSLFLVLLQNICLS